MATFDFAVISPERSPFSGQVNSVSLRSAGGDIGFLAGHVPYIGVVNISVCEVVPADGQTFHLAVHGGFVEVAPDGTVTLLADVVERAEEIDVARARAAQERAQSQVGSEPDANPEAQAALARAEVRLEVAGADASGPAPAGAGSPGSRR